MAVICNMCGLPEDLCACGELARDSAKIIIRLETRRFKKKGTMIEGIDPKANDVDNVAKGLKNKYACGGTAKDGYIFLQGRPPGNHKGDAGGAGLSRGKHRAALGIGKGRQRSRDAGNSAFGAGIHNPRHDVGLAAFGRLRSIQYQHRRGDNLPDTACRAVGLRHNPEHPPPAIRRAWRRLCGSLGSIRRPLCSGHDGARSGYSILAQGINPAGRGAHLQLHAARRVVVLGPGACVQHHRRHPRAVRFVACPAYGLQRSGPVLPDNAGPAGGRARVPGHPSGPARLCDIHAQVIGAVPVKVPVAPLKAPPHIRIQEDDQRGAGRRSRLRRGSRPVRGVVGDRQDGTGQRCRRDPGIRILQVRTGLRHNTPLGVQTTLCTPTDTLWRI